ncbi:MAG: Crp/Fnr family transcriptional regulator [Candidatus Zixiibacteriota bacterium]
MGNLMILTPEILRKIELLSGLSDEILEQIIAFSRLTSYSKSQNICMQGLRGAKFFILIGGKVRLYKTNHEGNETTLRILQQDNVFAETIIFDDNRYPVSADAVVDSLVLEIRKQDFQRLFESKQFCKEFAMMLLKKLRFMAERIEFLTTYEIQERFFIYLMRNYGVKEKYYIDISRKNMANAIGTIPATFSRLLGRLKKKNLILYEGKTLEILDMSVFEGL